MRDKIAWRYESIKCKFMEEQGKCNVKLRESKCQFVNFLDECKREEILLEEVAKRYKGKQGIYIFVMGEAIAEKFNIGRRMAMAFVVEFIKRLEERSQKLKTI